MPRLSNAQLRRRGQHRGATIPERNPGHSKPEQTERDETQPRLLNRMGWQ